MGDNGVFEGEIEVTGKSPQNATPFSNFLSLFGMNEGGGGGDFGLGKLGGALGKALPVAGNILGLFETLKGMGPGESPLPEVNWESMAPVSDKQIVDRALPGGPPAAIAAPLSPMEPPTPVQQKQQSKLQKKTKEGSEEGESTDESKMSGWDKAAIAANVASGLLNTQSTPLPNVGYTPGQPVSGNFRY